MKRITYILSTVFLLLLLTCGNIFAAPNTVTYLDGNGNEQTISSNQLNTLTPVGGAYNDTSNYLTKNWYILNKSDSNQHYILGSTSNVNIIVDGEITLTGTSWFLVPSGASINFYAANDASKLTVENSGLGFTIGNGPNDLFSTVKPSTSITGDFGNITFNSGQYTITNSESTTLPPAIGSSETSGKTITINSAATVTANQSNTSADNTTVVVGTSADNQNCNVTVNGDLDGNPNGGRLILNADTGSGIVSVGSGTFSVNSGGYVQTAFDNSLGASIDNYVDLNSGIVSWYDYTPGSTSPGYNLNLNGQLTFSNSGYHPTFLVGTQNLAKTITFEEDADIQFGIAPSATDSDGDIYTGFNFAATLNTGGCTFLNNGKVDIVNTAQAPLSSITSVNASNYFGGSNTTWNNQPGSTLTIGENQYLNANTTNGSSTAGSKAAQLNLNGATYTITNNSQVTVGPVGYTLSTLKNDTSGTISSQNPNYYDGSVWNMELGSSRLNFYTNQNDGNQQAANQNAVPQFQNVGFSAFGDNGTVLPSFFNYTLETVPAQSNASPNLVTSFTSATTGQGNLGWQEITSTSPYYSEYPNGYYLNGTNGWALIMTPSDSSVNPWDLILYSGGASAPGVYTLTAEPLMGEQTSYPSSYIVGNTVFANDAGTAINSVTYRSNLTDSVAVVVNTNTVSSLEITVDNQVVPSPYTVNLDEGTNVVDFGVIALGPNNTPVTNYGGETWTITYADGSPCTNVASVNPETGVVRFIAPTNQILYLNVTAQGVRKTLPIIVKGTIAPDSSIEAVNDPLYLTATAPFYDLDNNVKFMPSGIPASSSDANLPGITYTIQDNPGGAFIDSTGQIVTTNSNNTSTYTVLATTTIGGQPKTATFEVTFTGQTPTNPTGIAAETSLAFDTIDAADQNVNAHFMPATTSINQLQSGWYFEYDTSDPDVAIVDTNGNVTPVGVGTCTIITTVEGPTAYADYSATTNVTVTAEPSDIPATGITVTPEGTVYLAPPDAGEGAKTSETLTAALEPEDSTDTLSATISPESVATLTDNEDGTYTVNAVASGTATITFTAGDVEKQVAVVVNAGDYTGTITTTAVSPDTFTVTVSDLVSNPALPEAAGSVQNVSIFTWTGEMQTDMQCVRLENTTGSQTSFSHTFTVNGNENHQWYYNADKIYINVYASDNDTEGTFLGAATHTWMADQEAEASNRNVAYITYQEV